MLQIGGGLFILPLLNRNRVYLNLIRQWNFLRPNLRFLHDEEQREG